MSFSAKLGKFMLMSHNDTGAPILPSTWQAPLTAAQDTESHQQAYIHSSYRRAIDLHEKQASIFSKGIMLMVHLMMRELQVLIQVIKWLLYHQKEAENVRYMVQLSLPSGGEERKPEKRGADFIEGGSFHQFEEWWKLLVVPSPFNLFSFLFLAEAFFLGHVTLWGMPITWFILTCGLEVYF